MTQNPFETPQAAPVAQEAFTPGEFDIGRCLSEGWEVTKNNLGPLVGISVVGLLCIMVSYVTIIGLFVLVPVFMWGWAHVFLKVFDEGQVEVGDLFIGFKNFGPVLGQTLLLMLAYIVISLPGQALNIGGALADAPVVSAIGSILNLAITVLVTVRLYFAILFMVDKEMGAIEALKASWEVTANQKLMTVLLTIVAGLIGAIGMFALCVGLFVTLNICYLMYVSAYRQMVGPA